MQFLLNGLIAGSIYALVGISFSLIYVTVRFFHFGHGVVFTIGAYSTFLFMDRVGLPLFVSILLAICVSAFLGCLMEVAVYRPLRLKGVSSIVLLLGSLGMYIIFQNIISLIFGDDTKSIRSGVIEQGINIVGATITPIQILNICASLVLLTVTSLFMKMKIGMTIRAVANDAELAHISGIQSDRVVLGVFGIGSALAGLAGILTALDVDMTPMMGMNALLMGVVAVIIGGIGSIPGVAFGALFLGMAQHLVVWKINSHWQDAIAFVILLAFLIFRPQGLLGGKIKKATV